MMKRHIQSQTGLSEQHASQLEVEAITDSPGRGKVMTTMKKPLLLAFVALVGFAGLTIRAVAQTGGFDLEVNWVFDSDAAHPGSTINAEIEFKFDEGFHTQSNKPLDEFLVPTELTISPPTGISVQSINYPAPVQFEVFGFDEPLEVFEQEFAIHVVLKVGEDVEPGEYEITGALQYQACNDRLCLAPTSRELKSSVTVVSPDEEISTGESTKQDTASPDANDQSQSVSAIESDCDVIKELEGFTVLGTAGGFLGVDEFIEFVDSAESGTVKRNVLEDKAPLAILFLVIVGGLLLNLTPCVLPLIPINLAIIGAGAQAGSRARGFALGGTYGFAMAAVYGALGLIVTLTATTFGAINSTIWFNVSIAVLFILLGLAMFDVIHIDFSKFQSKLDTSKVGKQGTFALAFFMGGISALLAGACVAPVVIQVIVYAGDQYAKGETMALALPFFLGLGMALPWPFAGAGMSVLPKPGMWMVRVKQGIGLFIIVFGAYYAYVGWEIWDSTRVDPALVQGAVEEQLEGDWTASICDGLNEAREQDKPVLIDMWATWCKNCLAMDKSTFKDEKVIARLDDYIKIKYQSQDLAVSPNKDMIERFEQIGLPTYAILRPNKTN